MLKEPKRIIAEEPRAPDYSSGARNNANGVWKMARDTLLSVESKNIEYKVTLPDQSEKYMKTIVAFANTQGGKLIVGVDDKTHDFPF